MVQTAKKVKFATQADPEVLHSLREMARSEGRQLQMLVDEALRAYVERRNSNTPPNEILQALQASINQFDDLYKKLAQ
ncbi:MAG: hypothetical protein LBJ14_03025 [Desulfarculales bacterium]|jgi:hypothetical protein|nr:hypothetical protein [Desulfarculales bacterium]